MVSWISCLIKRLLNKYRARVRIFIRYYNDVHGRHINHNYIESVKIMTTRRPLMLIVKEITRRLKSRGYSIRGLEKDLKEIGFDDINRGKLIRLFYTSDKNQQDFLNNCDDTIEAVLTLLNITEEDLFMAVLNKSIVGDAGFPGFLKDPDAKPLLKTSIQPI